MVKNLDFKWDLKSGSLTIQNEARSKYGQMDAILSKKSKSELLDAILSKTIQNLDKKVQILNTPIFEWWGPFQIQSSKSGFQMFPDLQGLDFGSTLYWFSDVSCFSNGISKSEETQ